MDVRGLLNLFVVVTSWQLLVLVIVLQPKRETLRLALHFQVAREALVNTFENANTYLKLIWLGDAPHLTLNLNLWARFNIDISEGVYLDHPSLVVIREFVSALRANIFQL